MRVELPRPLLLERWPLAIAAGLVLGGVWAWSAELAIGGVVVLLAVVAFARSPHPAETLVGLYWIAYTVYSIVFYGVIIRFGFYPFYAAFVATAVLGLLRGGLRVDRGLLWLYVGFMTTVLVSFFGFADPIDSSVFQRVLAYLVGALVALQFRSRAGLAPVTTAAIIASAVVAGFTVFRSTQTDFGYRGGLDANPNAAAMLVAYGAVLAVGWMIDRWGQPAFRAHIALLLTLLGLMLYSVLLLASRGLTISLLASFAVMIGRAMAGDARKGTIVAAIAVIAGFGLLLPGGQNLLERFTSPDENLVSAGSRVPIWNETIQNVMRGDIRELLVGHGFKSSEDVVERRFAGQPSTHSTYLQVLYEFGVVSLALLLALFAYLWLIAWRTPGRHGLIMLGLTTLLIIENVTGDVANGFAFWIAMGYLVAIGTWGRDER